MTSAHLSDTGGALTSSPRPDIALILCPSTDCPHPSDLTMASSLPRSQGQSSSLRPKVGMGTVPAPEPHAGGASGRCEPTLGASHTGTSPGPSGRSCPEAGRANITQQQLQVVTPGFPEHHTEKLCVAQPGLARNQTSGHLDYEMASLESMSPSCHPWRPYRDLEQRCQETCDHGDA